MASWKMGIPVFSFKTQFSITNVKEIEELEM
jgi:hypothetical protein